MQISARRRLRSRKRLQGSGASVDQRINDGASVVYLGATRIVLYDGWSANYVAYDLFLRVGTGTA